MNFFASCFSLPENTENAETNAGPARTVEALAAASAPGQLGINRRGFAEFTSKFVFAIFAISVFEGDVTRKRKQIHFRGKNLLVCKKEADGSWKIFRYMYDEIPAKK